MKASKAKVDPMSKRVPRSQKYDHIQGRLDTGLTTKKVKVISVREFSRRRDEIFYRVQREQLEMLYTEYERSENEETMSRMGRSGDMGPTIVTHENESEAVYDRPYLLLDVRDARDYDDGHLLQARSFPHTMLRRDAHHPEIYQFRNKPEHMIILYCDADNETISRDAAKIMTDRGIDNVFLLTGGFKEMLHKFPHRVEGNMPELPVSPDRAPSRKCREKRQQLEALKDGLKSAAADSQYHRRSMDTISEAGSYNPVYKDGTDNGGRRLYSISTAGSPNVSDRVAKALLEQRSRYSASREQDRDGYQNHSSTALNSARLREHDRHEMDRYTNSARGSPDRRSYHRDYDDRSEGGRSVAGSVMSSAMRRRGRGY